MPAIDDAEIGRLHAFRDMLVLSSKLWKLNKNFSLRLLSTVLEGKDAHYSPGGGAKPATRRREQIFHQEDRVKNVTATEVLHELLNNQRLEISQIKKITSDMDPNAVYASSGHSHKFNLNVGQTLVELDPSGVVLERQLNDAPTIDGFTADIDDLPVKDCYENMSQCLSFDNAGNVEEKTVFSTAPPSNQHIHSNSVSNEEETGLLANRSASNQVVSFSRTESYSSALSKSSYNNHSHKKAKNAGNMDYRMELPVKVIRHVWDCFNLSDEADMKTAITIFPDLYEISRLESRDARWKRFDRVTTNIGIKRAINNDNPYIYLLSIVVYMISLDRPKLDYKTWKHEEFNQYKSIPKCVDRDNNPLFIDLTEDEMKILYEFRCMLSSAMEIIPMNLNKTCILRVVCRLVEGREATFTLGSGQKRIVSHKDGICEFFRLRERAEKKALKREKIIKDEYERLGPPLPDSSHSTVGACIQRHVSDGTVSELMRLISNNPSPDGTSDFIDIIKGAIVEPGCDLSLEQINRNAFEMFGKELTEMKTKSVVTDAELGLAKSTTSAKFDADTDVLQTQTVRMGRNLSSYDDDALGKAIEKAAKEGRVIRQDISIARRSSSEDYESSFDAYTDVDDLFSLYELREFLPDNLITQLERSRSIDGESSLLRSISISTQVSIDEALGMELNANFVDRSTSDDSSI